MTACVTASTTASKDSCSTLVFDAAQGVFGLVVEERPGTIATPRSLEVRQWKDLRLVNVQSKEVGAPLSDLLSAEYKGTIQEQLPIRPVSFGVGQYQLQQKVAAMPNAKSPSMVPDWKDQREALRRRTNGGA